MPSIVVSNASPLIAFALIRRVDLLQRVYQHLVIPPAVYEEVAGAANDLPGSDVIRQASWVEVRQPAYPATLLNLDAGESEAILLGLELGAFLLLMDELRGRRIALRMGMSVAGTLATLIQAKRLGHVAAVGPLLRELHLRGFRVSRALFEYTLVSAGESGDDE